MAMTAKTQTGLDFQDLAKAELATRFLGMPTFHNHKQQFKKLLVLVLLDGRRNMIPNLSYSLS